jgi:hypothetical protein
MCSGALELVAHATWASRYRLQATQRAEPWAHRLLTCSLPSLGSPLAVGTAPPPWPSVARRIQLNYSGNQVGRFAARARPSRNRADDRLSSPLRCQSDLGTVALV